MNFGQRVFLGVFCAGLLLAGFALGLRAGKAPYRYTKHLPPYQVTMAKYTATFCKEHNICDRAKVVAEIKKLTNEAEADTTIKKLKP